MIVCVTFVIGPFNYVCVCVTVSMRQCVGNTVCAIVCNRKVSLCLTWYVIFDSVCITVCV